MTSDNCGYPRCRNASDMIFYNIPLCNRCYQKACDEPGEVNFRKKLGIEPMQFRRLDGTLVPWRADGNYGPLTAGKVRKVLLFGLARKELRLMARELGVTWHKEWSKKEAKLAVKAAMREM